MARPGTIGVVAALLLGAGSARAQTPDEEAPGWGLTQVRVAMAPGHARLRVVYRVVGEPEGGLVMRSLSLPERSAVTAMRAREGGGWIVGALRDTDEAAEAFLGLPGLTRQNGSGRALIEWAGAGSAMLQLYPVERGKVKEVELTVLAPTRYEQGRELVDLEPLRQQGPVEIQVTADGAPAFVDGRAVGPAERLIRREGTLTVAAERRPAPPLGGRYAEVDTGVQTLSRLRIEAARRVAEVPRGAGVVVLLDASRSMSWAQQQAAAAVARRYLERHPEARASVLRFDRTVRPLAPGLGAAPAVVSALARSTPGQGNGSRLDLALEAAGQLLKDHPGPRRVLALTDGLVRSSLEVAALRRLTEATGAVVHIGILSTAGASLERDDDHEFAGAARATGGLVWQVSADGRAEPASTYEGLARPVSLDRLRVRALAHDEAYRDEGWPASLAEGEGYELIKTGPAATGFEVQGELWSQAIRAELKPSAAEGAVWGALAVGSSEFGSLSEPEQKIVARKARVVSPFSSLLALGPGPQGDLRDGTGSLHGIGGSGSFSVRDHLPRGPRGPGFQQVDVPGAVEVAWRRCTGGQGSASVALELTRSEVVDVASVEVQQGPPNSHACLEQALWQLDFPTHLASFARFEVRLPRG